MGIKTVDGLVFQPAEAGFSHRMQALNGIAETRVFGFKTRGVSWGLSGPGQILLNMRIFLKVVVIRVRSKRIHILRRIARQACIWPVVRYGPSSGNTQQRDPAPFSQDRLQRLGASDVLRHLSVITDHSASTLTRSMDQSGSCSGLANAGKNRATSRKLRMQATFYRREIIGLPRKSLKNMVGTRRLELLTSTVSR